MAYITAIAPWKCVDGFIDAIDIGAWGEKLGEETEGGASEYALTEAIGSLLKLAACGIRLASLGNSSPILAYWPPSQKVESGL